MLRHAPFFRMMDKNGKYKRPLGLVGMRRAMNMRARGARVARGGRGSLSGGGRGGGRGGGGGRPWHSRRSSLIIIKILIKEKKKKSMHAACRFLSRKQTIRRDTTTGGLWWSLGERKRTRHGERHIDISLGLHGRWRSMGEDRSSLFRRFLSISLQREVRAQRTHVFSLLSLSSPVCIYRHSP